MCLCAFWYCAWSCVGTWQLKRVYGSVHQLCWCERRRKEKVSSGTDWMFLTMAVSQYDGNSKNTNYFKDLSLLSFFFWIYASLLLILLHFKHSLSFTLGKFSERELSCLFFLLEKQRRHVYLFGVFFKIFMSNTSRLKPAHTKQLLDSWNISMYTFCVHTQTHTVSI